MNCEDPCGLLRRPVASACCAPAILALLWMLTVNAWSQRLPMRLYTTEDGLWSGFINYMMRDSHGFLWFCTRDGLSRFDGYRFTNYRIENGPPSQNFEYIYESQGGILWIILNGKGLYRYDPGVATTPRQPARPDLPDNGDRELLHAEPVSSTVVGEMLQDRSGNLWIAGMGLFQMEDKGGRVSFHEIDLHLPREWKPSFFVRTLAEGDDRSLWLGTSRGLLRRLSDGRVVQYHLNRPGPENVMWLLADKSGNIWAVPQEGPYVLKPEPLSALIGLGSFTSRRLVARRPDLKFPTSATTGEAIDLNAVDAFGGKAGQTTAICQRLNGQVWLILKTVTSLINSLLPSVRDWPDKTKA